MRLSDKERLKIMTYTIQQRIPESVSYKKKDYILTDADKLATGRAIWYIINLCYSCSSASSKATQKFRQSNKTIIERALKAAMPKGYLDNIERAKNKLFMEKLKETEGEQIEASN